MATANHDSPFLLGVSLGHDCHTLRRLTARKRTGPKTPCGNLTRPAGPSFQRKCFARHRTLRGGNRGSRTRVKTISAAYRLQSKLLLTTKGDGRNPIGSVPIPQGTGCSMETWFNAKEGLGKNWKREVKRTRVLILGRNSFGKNGQGTWISHGMPNRPGEKFYGPRINSQVEERPNLNQCWASHRAGTPGQGSTSEEDPENRREGGGGD